MSLIKFESVTLGYEGQPVIRNLDFEVNRGDYLCVLGQNGSGKSTMMKALLGFLPAMEGKIIKDKCLKNAIGYLPQQQPSQTDFPASVREVVLSGCQAKKKFFPFYNKEDKRLTEEKMRIMRVENIADRSFKELSGGQKQRVLLARALCAADDLLLLDEPVTGLDPNAASELYGLISELHAQGMTIIMISHDLENSLSNATHVLHIGQTMHFFGKAEDYDRDAVLEKEGGGK